MPGAGTIADLIGGLRRPLRGTAPWSPWFRDAGPYLRGALNSIGAILLVMLIYLIVVPTSYTSRWSLIVPGATNNTTFSLESVGQSSSSPNSPFGSTALSPKVIYKEIAESEPVREAAAKSLGLTLDGFAKPKTKLTDETALMAFEITARTPDLARAKAQALIAAFNTTLDQLRSDELAKRSSAVEVNMASYREQVRSARERIAEVQAATGLLSTAQFAEMLTTVTTVRRRLGELTGELEKMAREQAILADRLGIKPENARTALKLASDPAFAKTILEYGDATALYFSEHQRLGPQNPTLINMGKRRAGAIGRIMDLAYRNGITSEREIEQLVLLMNTSHQADLFTALVRNEALIGGRHNEIATLTAQRTLLESEVARLSTASAKLEDLKKDHLVAEAVLSSALAKLDTSKADIYGSYPIVQVLAAPSLPEDRAQPRPLYAAIGGLLGSLLAALAWWLAWLHHTHGSKRRKSA